MLFNRKFPLFETTPEGDNPPAPSPAPTPTPTPAPAPAPAATDDKLKAALDEASKAKKDLEAELAKYKQKEQEELDKQKSAEQKLAEKDAELKRLARENQLVKLAAQKGLDPDLIDRVKGETQEEIEADIDLLIGKFGKTESIEGALGKKAQAGKSAEAEDPTPTSGTQAKVASWMSARAEKLKQA